jgi:hypothetical protein
MSILTTILNVSHANKNAKKNVKPNQESHNHKESHQNQSHLLQLKGLNPAEKALKINDENNTEPFGENNKLL